MAFSRQSHIFYNNTQYNETDEEYRGIDEPDFRPNTMLEDQHTKFKKRNHYLRKSVVMVDSNYRDKNDMVNSQPLIYKRLGIIFSVAHPGKLIIYQPSHSLSKNDRIIFNSLEFYPGQKIINGLSISKFIFNKTTAAPIFNIYPISNTEIFKYISWGSLSTIVSNEYNSEDILKKSEKPNFYYFDYFLPETKKDTTDFVTVDSSGNIKISVVTSKTMGYLTTSYFKINFSKTLYNIYKLKLLDIKLPEQIFNINNVQFNINGYKYRQNSKIRFLLENNNFIVSNIDYVGNRIQYSFFNMASKSNNIYLASDIHSILTDVLSRIKSMPEFTHISEQFMFEIAYYFYTQYVLYYNKTDSKLESFSLENIKDATTNNSLYYVYTLDLINKSLSNEKTSFILKPYDTLNNKMPLIYFNDYILYVNNDTYIMQTIAMNWFDMIILTKNPSNKNQFPIASTMINNNKIDIGIIQSAQNVSTSNVSINIIPPEPSKNIIQYKIGFDLITITFNPKEYSNVPIYTILPAANGTVKIIENTSIGYHRFIGTYYYLDVSYAPTNNLEFADNMFKYDYTIYRSITTDVVKNNNILVSNKKITYTIGIKLYDYTQSASYVGLDITGPNNIINHIESYHGYDKIYFYDFYTVSYMITDSNKYMSGMLLPQKQIIIHSSGEIIGTASNTYEPFGQIKDVQFSVIIESIIRTGNPSITLPVDKIRIDKTRNASNQYIIDYTTEPNNILTLIRENTIISSEQLNDTFTCSNEFAFVLGSPIVFSGYVFGGVVSGNTYYILEVISSTSFTISDSIDGIRFPLSTTTGNMTCSISFPLTIFEQPKMDDTSGLVVFDVSLTTNHLIIPDIYVSQNYSAFHNSQQIGICYSFYYKPIYNTLIIEKYNTFQIEYLTKGEYYIYSNDYSRTEFTSYPNRNYISIQPTKTNMQQLETYDLYPEYEVDIPNGDYTDSEFAKALENTLNSVEIKKYNYLKKELEVPSVRNEKINNPEYSVSRFKVSYDEIQQSIDISSYSVNTKLQYTAIYDPIYPFMYIKLRNADIDNNQRMYIDVLNNNAKSNITNNVVPLLNKEVTARILPQFQYQLRVLYPLPQNSYLGTVSTEFLHSYNDLNALLSNIKIDPYNFTITQPNLSTSMRQLGQILLNQYKNSNSYIPEVGTIIHNEGMPNPILDDELCIVVNNIYYTYEVYKFGRIITNIDKTSNTQGNYSVHIQLCGDTRVSHPIWIGDIIYFLQSRLSSLVFYTFNVY